MAATHMHVGNFMVKGDLQEGLAQVCGLNGAIALKLDGSHLLSSRWPLVAQSWLDPDVIHVVPSRLTLASARGSNSRLGCDRQNPTDPTKELLGWNCYRSGMGNWWRSRLPDLFRLSEAY